jgi:hypothetical protein
MGNSQDGKYVATGSGEGELAIFRTSDMKWIHRKRVHDFFVSKVAFAPDRYVASPSTLQTLGQHRPLTIIMRVISYPPAHTSFPRRATTLLSPPPYRHLEVLLPLLITASLKTVTSYTFPSAGVMSLYGRELFVTFAVLVALLAIFIQCFVR